MFKVTVDDEVINDVTAWVVPGGVLLVLEFADGSYRGITGFVDFDIQRLPDSVVPEPSPILPEPDNA